MATVRIADDVNKALKAMARDDPDGRSVTQLVDAALRRSTGLVITPAQEPEPEAARAPRSGPARIGRPRARQAATAGPNAKCPHPIGRRINGHCAACGASVG